MMLNLTQGYVICRDKNIPTVKQRLSRIMQDTLHVLPAIEHVGQLAGNTLGHILVTELAMNEDMYPFIIFEEDAHLTQPYDIFDKQNMLISLDIPKDADIVRLDHSTWSVSDDYRNASGGTYQVTPLPGDWYRCVNMLGAAAVMIMNSKAAVRWRDRQITALMNGYAADVFVVGLNKELNVYSPKIPVFYQGPETNHNAQYTNFIFP